MYKGFVKQLLDFLFATLLILLLSPFFLLIGFVFLFYPEVIFTQERIGHRLKPFRIIKLRTLYAENSAVQRLGILLRKLSLDEIPQLLNILKGEMSFVGPRPLLPEYMDLYSNSQLKRHDVKPGITGLAQISGFNTLSWQSKFRLDLIYVRNISFLLDLRILVITFGQVLSLKRLRKDTKTIADAFTGSN